MFRLSRLVWLTAVDIADEREIFAPDRTEKKPMKLGLELAGSKFTHAMSKGHSIVHKP